MLLTVLALGVLGRLVPGLVRVLGFGRLGPVEGKFCSSSSCLLFFCSLSTLSICLVWQRCAWGGFVRFADGVRCVSRLVRGVVAAVVSRVCAEGIVLVIFTAYGHDLGLSRRGWMQVISRDRDGVDEQRIKGGIVSFFSVGVDFFAEWTRVGSLGIYFLTLSNEPASVVPDGAVSYRSKGREAPKQ